MCLWGPPCLSLPSAVPAFLDQDPRILHTLWTFRRILVEKVSIHDPVSYLPKKVQHLQRRVGSDGVWVTGSAPHYLRHCSGHDRYAKTASLRALASYLRQREAASTQIIKKPSSTHGDRGRRRWGMEDQFRNCTGCSYELPH